MSNHRILVTGGAGFIGSNLAEHLLKMGHKVIVLDDLSGSIHDNIRACYNYAPNFHFIKGSITNFELLNSIIQDVDAVFHLAAQVHWEESMIEPVPSFQINTMGTLNVLESVRRTFTRRNPIKLVVYASSSEVYGTAQYVPMDEKHPFNPQSPYAAGKAASDRLCSAYYHTYKMPVIILRQFNTYGPRQTFKGYSAVVPKFCAQVLSGSSPTIYGDGEQTKDFHYIDDLINAYELILDKYEELDIFGKAINFGTGIETSINELAKNILNIASIKTGRNPNLKPTHLPPRPNEVRRFIADITLAKNKLGFKPKVNLNEGLNKYIDWYMEKHHINPENIINRG